MFDFEVHIGFAFDPNAPVVTAIPPAWKREAVLNLVSLEDGHQYERHNVEGDLSSARCGWAGARRWWCRTTCCSITGAARRCASG